MPTVRHPFHLVIYDPTRGDWEAVVVRGAGRPAVELAAMNGRVAFLAGRGLGWTPPLSLSVDGGVTIGSSPLSPGLRWAGVAAAIRTMWRTDAVAAESFADSVAVTRLLNRTPAVVEPEAEAAARALADRFGANPRHPDVSYWDELSEPQRAGWRRKAVGFLRRLDGGMEPGRAISEAWMTEPTNGLSSLWLAEGGWDGEPPARQAAWEGSATLALGAARPASGPRP